MALRIYVKAAFEDGEFDSRKLGDCPFCHRVLLTAEEKGVPYTLEHVNLDDKPAFFAQQGFTATPIVSLGGTHLADSGKICELLEKEFPDPPLLPPESFTDCGGSVFGCFVQLFKYLTVTIPLSQVEGGTRYSENTLQEKKAKLVEALQGVATQIDASGGPFLCGKEVINADLALAPQLLHAKVALDTIAGVSMGTLLAAAKDNTTADAIQAYLGAMQARSSWSKTVYGEDLVQSGWRKHVAEWKDAGRNAQTHSQSRLVRALRLQVAQLTLHQQRLFQAFNQIIYTPHTYSNESIPNSGSLNIRTAYLGSCPEECFDRVAQWHHHAFGKYYGESLDQRCAKLRGRCGQGEIPSTVVALKSKSEEEEEEEEEKEEQEEEEASSRAGAASILLGAATLLDTDMPTHPQWSPWLASLYVCSHHRRCGVAERLIDRVAHEAGVMGHEAIYLWCDTLAQFAYYSKRGWRLVEVVDTYVPGKRLKVMSRSTATAASASAINT